VNRADRVLLGGMREGASDLDSEGWYTESVAMASCVIGPPRIRFWARREEREARLVLSLSKGTLRQNLFDMRCAEEAEARGKSARRNLTSGFVETGALMYTEWSDLRQCAPPTA